MFDFSNSMAYCKKNFGAALPVVLAGVDGVVSVVGVEVHRLHGFN